VLLDALPKKDLENLLSVKLGIATNQDLPELETEQSS